MTSLWTKLYAAKRRALDRALLASMERELAAMEKKGTDYPSKAENLSLETDRARIARAFGRPQ